VSSAEVNVIILLASVGLVTAACVRLYRRSPAALSEVDSPWRRRTSDGVGRPAGPDAEPMGVLDRGVIVTGPPPPGGVPTDAPPPRPARPEPHALWERWRSRRRARPARPRPAAHGAGPAPSDMVVALRGLERRYRDLFAAFREDESPEEVARRPAPDGWSAADHVMAATRGIAAASRALDAVLTADAPRVPPHVMGPAVRPEPAGTTGSVDDLLTELGSEATAAADRIAQVRANEWSSAAGLDESGRPITALDVARMAVDVGVRHLRAAGEVLAAVRDRSSPDVQDGA
jgi:hypothetical protein